MGEEPAGDPGELWGVAFNLVLGRWLAACYLCDWRGDPVDYLGHAQPDLDAHLASGAHRAKLRWLGQGGAVPSG